MANFMDFLNEVGKALGSVEITIGSGIPDYNKTYKKEKAVNLLTKYGINLDADTLINVLAHRGATAEELELFSNYIREEKPKISLKFDSVITTAASAPRYLGESEHVISRVSRNNVVHLENGEVVIAQPGDVATYAWTDYRWNGENWDRLG